MFAGNFAPSGWLFCDGSVLPIAENEALFTLIGTTYGGDGASTFALPDLRGRVPVHQGGGFVIGQSAGSETTALTPSQLPVHHHQCPLQVGPCLVAVYGLPLRDQGAAPPRQTSATRLRGMP